jgi:hypothetical protein
MQPIIHTYQNKSIESQTKTTKLETIPHPLHFKQIPTTQLCQPQTKKKHKETLNRQHEHIKITE